MNDRYYVIWLSKTYWEDRFFSFVGINPTIAKVLASVFVESELKQFASDDFLVVPEETLTPLFEPVKFIGEKEVDVLRNSPKIRNILGLEINQKTGPLRMKTRKARAAKRRTGLFFFINDLSVYRCDIALTERYKELAASRDNVDNEINEVIEQIVTTGKVVMKVDAGSQYL